MPEIMPFRALRYSPSRCAGQWDRLIAPPYDVLSADDKAALLRGHDRNIVAIDLPHVPPKEAGPDEVYAQAAGTLQQWRQDGTLALDDQPALYVYHQEYSFGGKGFLRRKFFARMRLEPFGTGTVFPHEQTFGGPKADRLKLMQATRCQLSAVFGLYGDPDHAVSKLLDPRGRPADVTATMEGVVNRLWVLQDAKIARSVADHLARRPVFIADGHHRYGTALNYRDQLQGGQALPADHPAHFTLIGLCAMEDPGAVIMPTHRVLSGFGKVAPARVIESLAQGLMMKPAGGVNEPEKLLPWNSADDLCVYVAAKGQAYTARFTRREVLAALAPERSAAWRKLDLAYLHRYLIDELVTKAALGGTAPTIQYLKAADQAIDAARQCHGIALLCKPCTMAELKAVSEAGDLMPQKSTYFYPKLATGLVINPLE
ncbi:MAG TPA: DUF1015 domain-containing protein [Phycisphaerae bacterium]|nr:DUF1015 domain-containing protein [Phycisphaerae bacterium]HRY71067.1 DUF1015 domain-containing protein [Phycisphaerae bacterium]HSA29157.1 DUF1015 domain-containing protein [Phycisphaerae bacterium]